MNENCEKITKHELSKLKRIHPNDDAFAQKRQQDVCSIIKIFNFSCKLNETNKLNECNPFVNWVDICFSSMLLNVIIEM